MVEYRVYADELEEFLRGAAMETALEMHEVLSRLRGGLEDLTTALEPFDEWPGAVVGQGNLEHAVSTLDGDAAACHTRVANAITLGDEVVQAIREGDRMMMHHVDQAFTLTNQGRQARWS